jgi:hypothetical protein
MSSPLQEIDPDCLQLSKTGRIFSPDMGGIGKFVAKGGLHVTINLVADQHYFIETSVLNSGFAFGNVNLVIKEVTCEGAQQDNVDTKPLEPTHLRPDGVPIAVSDKTFLQCP